MVETSLALTLGAHLGVALSPVGGAVIDLPATVVSRVGALYGLRFATGPWSRVALDDMVAGALAQGVACAASLHDIAGEKVLRVSGGLQPCLLPDLQHFLGRVGVDALDASGVTAIDPLALAPCVDALMRGVRLSGASDLFAQAIRHISLPMR